MAAPSPAPISNTSGSGLTPAAAAVPQSTTLRGRNKPRCIQCGNVARSRCPYQSCKSCCSKAQNPCHIHVLKANATIPDKAPHSSIISFGQQTAEPSPATSCLRDAVRRQLSNNFIQFKNVQGQRSRKPPTKKEALAINEWRFGKLKEYRDRNAEKQNEAFDRYTRNISLLEDVFSMKSMQRSSSQDVNNSEQNVRKKKQRIVGEVLKKLEVCEFRRRDKVKTRSERASRIQELIEKLNETRNEDVLRSCLEMKAQLFGGQNEHEWLPKGMDHFSSEVVRAVDISEQEIVSRVNAHFTSLDKIASI